MNRVAAKMELTFSVGQDWLSAIRKL